MEIQVQQFILIFCRMTAFIALCPGFSFKSFPNSVKIGLAFSLTTIVFPSVSLLPAELSLVTLGGFVLKEVLVGLALGYVSQLLFSGIEIAGQLVDFQVGFSMGAIYDPAMGVNASNYGRIYYWLGIAVFFLMDLHHTVIKSLLGSFQILPVTTAHLDGATVEGVLKLFVQVFEIALGLAAPLLLVALMVDIILGIISRTVPQINVLMLGMPLKITVSFFIFLLLLPNLVTNLGHTIEQLGQFIQEFVKSLA